ncbi:MAG: invasion-associated locus B family protein [Rhizobiales bacterium 65-79]|jgi:invasion protein IalB|nr:invasion associated locus B family protein [Hyphomicrobiales bacterium]OJU06585.1 MAG: invasion-associated locus B family protein [Rhizobiales bacterium 65-79]
MTRHTTHACRLTVAAAALAAAMAAVAPADAQNAPNQPPRGWFKACSKQQDVDICNVQNIVMADTGQLMTGVSLIDIKGKVNRKVFQVTVPTGRMIPPGISLQIDGGKAQKLDYVICFPDRCVAEAQLNDTLVASFKKGQKLTLTSINFQNQPNPLDISLAGFTDAFDGAPLKESDLQDRQKKLKDFVAKNNEDFAKKLKEEQDKAKQGK